jgi:hypothetical protein
VEEVGLNATGGEVGADRVPHGHVPGEDQRGVFGQDDVLHQLVEGLELAGQGGLAPCVPAFRGLAQVVRGGVADLAQRLQ